MNIIMKTKGLLVCLALLVCFNSCKKSSDGGGPTPPVDPPPASFSFNSVRVNGVSSGLNYIGLNASPVIKLSFNAALSRTSVANGAISFRNNSNATVLTTYSYENGDSTVVLQPTAPLPYLAKYSILASTGLKSATGGNLLSAVTINLTTGIDSTRKFPDITDNALLDLVQKQTFKYFYDFGHPVSGLARERNTSGETVTSGGSGFGIMALITGVSRNFITRAEGLARMQKIVGFLKNTAQTVKGAYPHWLNGTTGAIIPFSAADNGADLVETSYLIQGLICARQYFSNAGDEATLRADINTIVNRVEWDWFRQNNQNVLYWHYSNTGGFSINMKIQGWNESLITYVLGASSATHSIPKAVYTNGWANNGGAGFVNGNTYYGYTLPLGPNLGGPLFFEHYSFLGINPNGLTDVYANYATQTKNHTLINYNYCKANPKNYYGYSDSVWGLTASDISGGYTASSPTNDVGVIAPTAALSSFPYTPTESMKALKFYYYVLGDKLFKEYGFVDAFSLHDQWFADSYLAIDQGPIIVMIENYRTQLLWNLFTSAPEVKAGMTALGFTAPYL
ncbi:glucoamylase family protein [Ferruginibacter sp. HRS2-29]|uniref:glucoamylase family protein n=1 Tax=Ferruginibacter sp. HRS2-29 TaxID=2487334 RepID=UPI0020CCD817|nr:glucoamylase family protein [Ferruginibacter sp. HRS2-29]MCP9749717.1 beta-glucosidase [Ferruginibacter sp. HRS2-29]